MISASALPLSGLKVLVTRPRDQAAPLVQAIASAGGEPLPFPLLDIAPVQDQAALRHQLAHLASVDLLIFISPNAVGYGMAALASVGGLPSGVRVATVGQGSAKALRAAGVEAVIAPTERYDSEGLLALPELQQVAGSRVMIVRGDGGRELLGDTLKARGAAVEYLACYQRRKPQLSGEQLLAMRPDAITVTSSEALGYFWEMLDAAARHALRDVPLFVPHPRIAALAETQGWRRVHLTGAGDEGLLAALQDWAATGRGA